MKKLRLLDWPLKMDSEWYCTFVKACIVGPKALSLYSIEDEDDPSAQSLFLQSYFRQVVDMLNWISSKEVAHTVLLLLSRYSSTSVCQGLGNHKRC
jgi:hypothetical protein